MKEIQALSFDDIILEPQFSDIEHRRDIDISSYIGNMKFKLPIISSPMDTVTEFKMVRAMHNAGGMGIVHRFMSIKDQVNQAFESNLDGGYAIGVTGDYLERAKALTDIGVKIICIDIAHGHHILMKKALETLKKELNEDVYVIAGNIATSEAFYNLADWGADAIKVGIGGGSICSTREMTGHGVPLLTSIMECGKCKKYRPGAALIADGGIRTSGDIVKALWAGADFCMLGSMLAASEESPGEVVNFGLREFNDSSAFGSIIYSSDESRAYKRYRGMASKQAQKDWKGQVSSNEGVSVLIPYKGSVKHILNELEINIKSGLSYSGSSDIFELRNNGKMIQITNAGKHESTTHILNAGGKLH